MTNLEKVRIRPNEDTLWASIESKLKCGCCGESIDAVSVSHIEDSLILQCACNEIICMGTMEQLRAMRVPEKPTPWARGAAIAPAFRRWLAAEAK